MSGEASAVGRFFNFHLALVSMLSAWVLLSAPLGFAGDCPPSDDTSTEGIRTFLAEWDQAQEALDNRYQRFCTAPPVAPASSVRFVRPGPWPRSACDSEANIDRVCHAASWYCYTDLRGPDPGCWYGLGRPPTCVPDRDLVVSHRRILDYAARRFYSIIRNPDLQNHCCGTDQGCRRQWSSTHLKLLMGLGADDATVLYRRSTGDIHVSVGALVNCTTQECIDHLFFHELGHACDNTRERNTREALARFTTPQIAQCVINGLENSRRSAQTEVNFESWIQEALADAIFISEWSGSPGGWAWDCNSVQDAIHCAPRTYMGCFLEMPSVRRQVCGR